MNIVLFDTDVLIDLLRGKQETFAQVMTFVPGARLFCSVITVAEIYAGMFPHEKNKTEELLQALQKIPITEEIASLAGQFRNTQKHLELLDCMIAATAIILGAQLLTKNIKHYPMKSLQVTQIR